MRPITFTCFYNWPPAIVAVHCFHFFWAVYSSLPVPGNHLKRHVVLAAGCKVPRGICLVTGGIGCWTRWVKGLIHQLGSSEVMFKVSWAKPPSSEAADSGLSVARKYQFQRSPTSFFWLPFPYLTWMHGGQEFMKTLKMKSLICPNGQECGEPTGPERLKRVWRDLF